MSQLPLFSLPAFSVTDLTRYLRDLFEGDPTLRDIWVEGEVSNFSRPSSGHLYFTLKDQGAALRCVMWRNGVVRQNYLPREGDAVQVHGYIGLYEAGGQYQLYADTIRPAGEGALYQQFLRMKARLESEGLFDGERKRPLPEFPQRIGIITSPTGAALRDMLKTISRRYPLVEVLLAPTSVQGDEAPSGIVDALRLLNQYDPAPDVILLARGGGSIEDLWAFNDEKVARAIFASVVPVVTGVGHETDFTIADFVADVRAPTPTAAAELATPDQQEMRQRLDEMTNQLGRAVVSSLADHHWTFHSLSNRLAMRSPMSRLLSDRQRLDEIGYRLKMVVMHQLAIERAHCDNQVQRLAAFNPRGVLQRGFALVSRLDGALVSQVAQAQPGDQLNLDFYDGRRQVEVLPEQSGSGG